jgi:hypothetical protein
MKNKLFIPVMLALFFMNCLMLAGCKKDVDPGPEYPQLIGRWTGSTSQSQPINIYVDYFNKWLNIYQYNFVIYYNSGGAQTISGFNMDGISGISNKYFSIPLGNGIYGPAYLEGTFNLGSMTLSGTFRVYNPNDPNDATSGYYSALLSK